jgi:hypothetical protein
VCCGSKPDARFGPLAVSIVQDSAFETQYLSRFRLDSGGALSGYAAAAGTPYPWLPRRKRKERHPEGAAPLRGYFSYTKCARRFCCQHSSVCSVQKGRSLP